MTAPTPHRFTFRLLPETLAVCRLAPTAPPPAWIHGASFVALTRTPDELSIVCEARRVPADVRSVGGRRALGIVGTVDFSTTGVIAGLTAPLAAAGISVFVISTFDTDYVLVEERNLDRTVAVWRALGHEVAD
jgi:uncharacterized protein